MASQSGNTKMVGAAISARISRTITSMATVNSSLTPFLRREVIGRIRLDRSRRNNAIVPHTAQQDTHLLEIPRHGHFDQGGIFSAFGRTPAGEIEWPKRSVSVAPRRALEGENVRLCLRRRSKSARMVLTWTAGRNRRRSHRLGRQPPVPRPIYSR